MEVYMCNVAYPSGLHSYVTSTLVSTLGVTVMMMVIDGHIILSNGHTKNGLRTCARRKERIYVSFWYFPAFVLAVDTCTTN